MAVTRKSPWKRNLMLAILLLIVVLAVVYWYYASLKYDDTGSVKASYSIGAMDLLNEYHTNDSVANKKYRGQMMIVKGKISQLDIPDTSTVNVKFVDSTGSYLIFQFQSQHLTEGKSLKEGQDVSIKGECDGVAYSSILEVPYITFSRAALEKN